MVTHCNFDSKGCQFWFADLLQDGSDVPEWEWAKLAVLKEVIKVLLQHLKHQTGVTLVLEALVRTHKVVFIRVLCAQPV